MLLAPVREVNEKTALLDCRKKHLRALHECHVHWKTQPRRSSGVHYLHCVRLRTDSGEAPSSPEATDAAVQVLVLSLKSSDELVLCSEGLKFVRGSNHLIKE